LHAIKRHETTMATNKHAIIRYRVIDRCLRQPDRQWNWKSLAAACATELEKVTGKKTTLSERTIKGDLQNMRHDEALGYFAPIEYDRAEKSYYYSNRSFNITEAPLNKSDSKELKGVIALLRQYTGFSHLAGIENIIQKLELLAEESITSSKKIVHLAQPTTIPGQKWLDTLYEAIKQEKTLMLRYQPFGKEASDVVISPYLLKEFDHRWYLYALSHKKGELRTYGLERINELKPSLQMYKTPESFDPDSYFNDIIGITLNDKKKPVVVEFEVYGASVQYIKTKPLHLSQKELKSETHKSTFQLSLIPNFELESLMLSFGEAIKVLKPKSLSQKISKRAALLNGLYN